MAKGLGKTCRRPEKKPEFEKEEVIRMEKETGLIGSYTQWMNARGMAKWTVKSYASILRGTARLAGGTEALRSITAEELERVAHIWIIRRKTPLRDWRPPINLFFKFLKEQDLRQDNPLRPEALKALEAGTKRPARTEPDMLSRLRDQLIFRLMTENGLKPEELRVMAVGCCDLNLGRLNLGLRRSAYLKTEMTRALKEYLEALRGWGKPTLTMDSPLFADTENGGMLPEEHYWGIVRQGLRAAEIWRGRGDFPMEARE
jgi:site-specific recombinase XerD